LLGQIDGKIQYYNAQTMELMPILESNNTESQMYIIDEDISSVNEDYLIIYRFEKEYVDWKGNCLKNCD